MSIDFLTSFFGVGDLGGVGGQERNSATRTSIPEIFSYLRFAGPGSGAQQGTPHLLLIFFVIQAVAGTGIGQRLDFWDVFLTFVEEAVRAGKRK